MRDIVDFNKIVSDSKNIDNYEKELLRKLFMELQAEQKKQFENIVEKIDKQWSLYKKKDKQWDVFTALIENTEEEIERAKNNGFYPIVKEESNRPIMFFDELLPGDNKKYNAGIIFLKCKYSELDELTQKDYTALVHFKNGNEPKSVRYRFYLYDVFLKKEEIVSSTALQYEILKPPIYSPMSRRAMVVMIDFEEIDISKGNEIKIDFQYEKNGISSYVLTNKIAIWNVNIEGKDQIPRPNDNTNKKVIPLFDKYSLIYSFNVDFNEFIYVHSENLDLERIENDIYLGISEKNTIDSLDYMKIILQSVNIDYLQETLCYFENSFDRIKGVKERVRTKGDVFSLLSCFKRAKLISCQTSLGDSKAIRVYDKKRAYNYFKNSHLRSSSICYLHLEPENDDSDLYFEDYVSYIISYLNYLYPEFYWVGVR